MPGGGLLMPWALPSLCQGVPENWAGHVSETPPLYPLTSPQVWEPGSA